MSSNGTYAELMEADKKSVGHRAKPPAHPVTTPPAKPAEVPSEELSTTPYISQNYRFTEDELRWLRRQAYNLTERFGTKVSQNTILRVALHFLRDAAKKTPKQNPLIEALTKLKK